MTVLAPLPIYPSTQARKALSASQLATFNKNISAALSNVLDLPPAKRDTPATRVFLTTYVGDAANHTLQTLIWEHAGEKADKSVRKGVLSLAEKLAQSPTGLDLKTLLDIAVVYSSTNSSRVRALFTTCLASVTSLPQSFEAEVVPAFTTLLSPAHSSGLYGLRKTSRCIASLLNGSPAALMRPFSHNKDFILSLARAYDEGLRAIAVSYGGIRTSANDREPDDWERIWMETKVDLMDSFHIIISTMLKDVSLASGPALAAESERTFGIVFALLELPSTSSNPEQNAPGQSSATPFLDRSLVADHQHAYNLARMLASALRHAAREDDRVELLESTLQSFDIASSEAGGVKDSGALKLLIRSSGAAPGINLRAKPSVNVRLGDKGKARDISRIPESVDDPNLDLQVTQVLDIFPDHSPAYIRALLAHPDFPFRGSAEKVIEALLEGTAPGEDVIGEFQNTGAGTTLGEISVPDSAIPIERKNVFDDEAMDLSQVHIGKRRQAVIMRDRSYIEQMKADILRRAEAMSDDDEEGELGNVPSRFRASADADDDSEFDTGAQVKVVGDGEESGEEQQDDQGDGDDAGEPPSLPDLQTVLELAYIQDPKLFDRDAQTRRSKARADLKTRTGWSDEQIEGWRIMLERNPKKDRILQKHEFAGNKAGEVPVAGPSGSTAPIRGGERGRGRGGRGRGGRGGGGSGRGGGRPGESGGSGDASTRERAWKDKNKASRANHNRKRGHDKKMAKAGGGP
ncbi:hypothetical protein BV22DRAFT_1093520, partial [Leucogyrophana mollusca]